MTEDVPESDVRQLASRVRLECLRRGWDVGELAQRAGVSRTTLYHLEKGHTRRLRSSTVNAIAAALDVSVDALLALPREFTTAANAEGSTLRCGDHPREPSDDLNHRHLLTIPAVAEVIRERPGLFAGWSPEDWEALDRQCAAGGPATTLGVLSSAESINERRETVSQLQLVLDSHLRDVVREVIETFYRMVSASGSSDTGPERS